MRVLYVDDDDDNRKQFLIAARIAQVDLDIDLAASVDEAETKINGVGQYDMIVSDVIMPARKGWELIPKAKKRGFPLVFVTAYTDQAEKDQHLSGHLVLGKGMNGSPTQVELCQAISNGRLAVMAAVDDLSRSADETQIMARQMTRETGQMVAHG